MELISVIVPVYKVEPYLDRCVESIVNQTYRNLEIILVDDGSPDNCPAMCDAWAAKDSRIKVIHKQNGGLSDARNAGMAVAQGVYTCFVDSDDWIHLEYIERLHHAVQVHGADIAACDVRIVNDGDSVLDEPAVVASVCYTAEQALGTLIKGADFRAVAWNKLYRTALLQGEQFPVGRYHEDEFFTYRIMAKAQKLAYVNSELYYYFQRSGSIMNSISIKHLDALDAYVQRLRLFEKEYPAIYRQDKLTFCTSCVMFYRDALRITTGDRKSYTGKIKAYRKQICFSASEIFSYPVTGQMYILGSRFCIGLFSRFLNLRRGE